MFWLGMVVIMISALLKQGWSEWGFRITVISSLVANLVVGILSGTRRRLAPGLLWGFLGLVAQFFLWGAYQVAEAAATSAIGSLSLCGSDASEVEKQVVAFWAPFLLLHLGGPDNLTAYALEDNEMSKRKWLEIFYRILGICYTIYNNTHGGGRSWGLLLAASIVMLLAGGVRYVERARALGKANLENMQEDTSSSSSSSKDDDKMSDSLKCRVEGNASSSSSSKDDDKMLNSLKCRIKKMKRLGRPLRDGEALLLAQELFPVWRHALVDSSVDPASKWQQASEEVILTSESDGRRWDWESMCTVVEMELSLIYEFLYTKAILAQSWTWRYYLIRLLSPLSTAAAAFLFSLWLLHPDNGRQVVIRGSFVRITYALLTITFLMDVAWLLRALGSTWAHAYVQEHAAGRRWWCRLHRIVVRLDPLQLFGRDPVSHKRWSGTIGRYNLLHECSATRSQCHPEWWPVSMAGDDKPKEMRYLSKLPPCVKKLLFQRVTEILQQAINITKKKKERKDGDKDKGKNKNMYNREDINNITKKKEKDGVKDRKMYRREDIRTYWGHKAFRSADEQVKSKLKERIKINKSPPPSDDEVAAEATIFGTEFEEDVLLWHIATCMLLPLIRRKGRTPHTWAIEVLSEYMMFLVAIRRKMLPGLVLHSQLQVTRKTLVDDVWDGGEKFKKLLPDGGSPMMDNKEKFAKLLRCVKEQPLPGQPSVPISGNEGTQLLMDAVDLYFILSDDNKEAARPQPVRDDEMLGFIFNVWVDKLVYAAIRCSREAHAKQLSAGGDLTTVLWMLIQHAGPFCIGEANDIYLVGPKPKAEPSPFPKVLPVYPKPSPPPPPPPSPPPPCPCPPCRPPYSPCPVCPPCYHPTYPPECPPCYNPSCPPVCPPCYNPSCPWHAQCPPQHEKSGDHEREEDAGEDEHEDSSSDEDSEE